MGGNVGGPVGWFVEGSVGGSFSGSDGLYVDVSVGGSDSGSDGWSVDGSVGGSFSGSVATVQVVRWSPDCLRSLYLRVRPSRSNSH